MDEKGARVVADTSVVINLNATDRAREILDALPYRIVVTNMVASEFLKDRRSGRHDAALLKDMVETDHIRVVDLGEAGLTEFAALVIGPAGDTLDDGEAATIAYAVEHRIPLLIDERKASRICRERFPLSRLMCSVDLFAEPAVGKALGADQLVDVVFRALRGARMRVPFERLAWVVDLIGPDRAALRPSLPKTARER